MPLSDVRVIVKDGQLGILPPGAGGVHAKVGVSSKQPAGIVTLTDRDQIAQLFGVGPLADALFDSFGAGAPMIHAVAAQADIPGALSAVTATKTGSGNLTVSGSPNNAYQVIVEIVDPGRFNTASFHYSLDGGDTWSSEITVQATYTIPDTGITLNFTEDGVNPDNSFKSGDRYAFTASAPQASINSINAAIDLLLNSNLLYEFIHVVGPASPSVWAAMAVRADEAEAAFRYIHFLLEARGPNASETVDQWVQALLADGAVFSHTRVSICAARGEVVDAATGRIVDRNLAGIYAGRVSRISVQQSPAEVNLGPLSGIVRLNPPGINDGHISQLNDGGFITFRTYIGLAGFYVTEGRIKAPPTSDFQYVELRRVMDKACHQVRMAALRFKHGEATEAGLRAMEAQLSSPLNIMAGAGEIVSGRVVIPRDQNLLAGAKLRAKVRIVPVPLMRDIEIEMAFENPFLAPAPAAATPA